MKKYVLIFMLMLAMVGCIKERYIGQYVSTTFPVIEFTDNSGTGAISLISNKGDKNGGFDIVASLNKLSNNKYIIHADVTPTFWVDSFLETSFYLILLDAGEIVRSIRVPSAVHVSTNKISINKEFENDIYFDSFTFFYQTSFRY